MRDFREFCQMVEVSFDGKFQDYFGEKNILDDHTLVIFDCETTGLDPRIPHVQILRLSAASFDVNGEKMLDVFNKFANLNHATKKRLQLDKQHGIQQDNPSYRYIDDFLVKSKWNQSEKHGSELDVVLGFVDFLSKFNNVLLCGYNVKFDLRMVNTCLKRNGEKPLEYPIIDVMNLVHIFLDPTIEALAAKGVTPAQSMITSITNAANKKSYTLQNVAKILNVLMADGHVSLADIEMTGKVLTQAIKFIQENQHKLDDDYINYEKKSRKAYRDKLDFFHSMRNHSHDEYKLKKKYMDMVEKDVSNGVFAYIKHLESKAEKERQSPDRRYAKLRDIQLKINTIKSLLEKFSGDKSEILKFIYNS